MIFLVAEQIGHNKWTRSAFTDAFFFTGSVGSYNTPTLPKYAIWIFIQSDWMRSVS